MDTFEPTLRDRVAAYLAETGQSQAALARACGITPQRLQQVIDGVAIPGLALALRLRDVTGIPIDYFAEGVPPAHRETA